MAAAPSLTRRTRSREIQEILRCRSCEILIRRSRANFLRCGRLTFTRFAAASTREGSTPELELTAKTAAISGNDLTLTFYAEDGETDTLGGSGRVRFWVDLKSDNNGDVSLWDAVAGTAMVRDKVGASS